MIQEDDSTRRYLAAGLGGLAVALALSAAYTLSTWPARGAASRQSSGPSSELPRGGALPSFELPRLGGGTVRLADLKGRVVVVDFWATWCPPCRREMPWLVAMATRLEAKGVAFVAISEDDPPGQVPLVTQFAQLVPGLERYAALGDPEVEARFGVTALPTLFITDRAGRLVARLTGAAEEAEVVQLVERLVGEAPPVR